MLFWSAQRYGSSALQVLESTGTSSHARAEDEKLRKELTLEVLALKVPFGSLLGVSESSPVAGAIQGKIPVKTLDAGRARELHKCAQPATQLLSVHCLYQATRKSARGYSFFRSKVYRVGTRTPSVQLVQVIKPALFKRDRIDVSNAELVQQFQGL